MRLIPAGFHSAGAWDSRGPLFLAIGFQVALCLISLDTCLFWDTIQFASRHPSHFFFGGGFWLPESINSGNPPLLGWLVHSAWTVFGRDLWVTHMVTWPFLAANIVLLFSIGKKISPASGGWLPLLWLSVPVYAAQSTLASPDVLLVTGVLLVVHSMFYPRIFLLGLGGILLGLVSLRGTAVLLAIMAWWFVDARYRRLSWALIPGFLLASSYYALHYRHFGWALVPVNSPWAGSFHQPGPEVWLRQAGIFIWRLIDHGLLFLWLAILSVRPWRSGLLVKRPESVFLLLMMGLFAVFFTFFGGLNLHRYLLPVFLAALIWLFAHGLPSPRLRIWLVLALLCGNFWTYPEGVARGWDATLAWIPWSQHRERILDIMERNRIDPGETATCFPNLGPLDEVDLSKRQEEFLTKDKLGSASYFFYSNVFNDLTENEIERLRHWTPVASSGVWPISVTLLKNSENELP